MIIKVIKGRDPLGLCKYLLDPGKQLDVAVNPILYTNMCGANPWQLAEEFRFISQLNPRVINTVCHFSVSLPPHEKADPRLIKNISLRLLHEMGYERCPFFIVQHHDQQLNKDVQHWHVATSNVNVLGFWIDDAFNYARLNHLTRQLEAEFGLQVCLPKPPLKQRNLSSGEHRLKHRTGMTLPKEILWQKIDAAAENAYTLPIFVERLLHDGVGVQLKIMDGIVKGISYAWQGSCFSGSQLGPAFSLNGLIKLRLISYNPERDNDRLNIILASTLPSNSVQASIDLLHQSLNDLEMAAKRFSNALDRATTRNLNLFSDSPAQNAKPEFIGQDDADLAPTTDHPDSVNQQKPPETKKNNQLEL